jgi:hypothetical protein
LTRRERTARLRLDVIRFVVRAASAELVPGQSGRLTSVERGMNVLALVKGTERYVFLYDDESHRALLQTMGRYAADPDLSFTWYDAAVLSQKVRRLRDEQRPHRAASQRFPDLT